MKLTCMYCGGVYYTQSVYQHHLVDKHGIKITFMEANQVKKFYVGSDSPQTSGWGKDSVEEAIEHGKKILEDDPKKNKVYIVQVIKIVKRPRPEMIVVDVE